MPQFLLINKRKVCVIDLSLAPSYLSLYTTSPKQGSVIVFQQLLKGTMLLNKANYNPNVLLMMSMKILLSLNDGGYQQGLSRV
ncbi:unnamed protein product [Caenorhabditis brenneri]